MDHQKEKFYRVLLIELEDLQQDLREAVQIYQERNASGDVTNYVMRENAALLENEISGLELVCRTVGEMAPDEEESLGDLVERVRSTCRKRITDSHFPDALCGMVDRKISKVEKYIRE